MKTLTYTGWLKQGYAEADEALYLGDPEDQDQGERPLADLLEEAGIINHQVSVSYWITTQKVSRADAQEAFLSKVFGGAEVEWFYHYSDETGFLWIDQELVVGGHDLMAELQSNLGKWVILEIIVHD